MGSLDRDLAEHDIVALDEVEFRTIRPVSSTPVVAGCANGVMVWLCQAAPGEGQHTHQTRHMGWQRLPHLVWPA